MAAFASGQFELPAKQNLWEAHVVNSTLKVQKSEATTLIERIKAEIKKRVEAKAKRMLLKRPTKRYG